MAGEERYLEWLDRMEETFGLDDTVRMSTDIEYARLLLYDELGWDESDPRTVAFIDHLEVKYEEFPSIGVIPTVLDRDWGSQVIYRDAITGHFVSYGDVQSALETLRGK